MQRRELLRWSGALTLLAHPGLARYARGAELPTEVAGVRLPRTPLALAAADFARASCPDYLFNHCMRTFLFGALLLKREQREYRREDAFIGAALHDLGLLPAFETPKRSFETDGADAAERWVRQNHGSPAQADRIWHAVQMHDGAFALTRRQGPEAMLVALGAGTDVDGPDPGELDPRELGEVVAAFPRLKFKTQFTALLVAHCERKPASQRATWLEGLCRAHAPHPTPDNAVEQEIASAAFAE
jgi:hypothetical protein